MIDILLATYNGARWLPELRISLMQQTEQRFSILARDDGSNDDTVQILKKFQRDHPGKLDLIKDELGNLGVMGNFNCLMGISQAPYVIFCDQDDIQLPEKIERTFQRAVEWEGELDAETPILVHTDLQVVDSDLEILVRSGITKILIQALLRD